MKFEVIFSAKGYDNTAYFDSECDCNAFAELMAESGRLVKVVADGKDITGNFVVFVTFAELAKR